MTYIILLKLKLVEFTDVVSETSPLSFYSGDGRTKCQNERYIYSRPETFGDPFIVWNIVIIVLLTRNLVFKIDFKTKVSKKNKD